MMLKPISIALLLILCSACGRPHKFEYEGQVLSKHLIPVPDATVTIGIGEGGRDGSWHYKSTVCDSKGHFSFKGTMGMRQWPNEILVHSADSGHTKMNEYNYKEYGIEIVLQK